MRSLLLAVALTMPAAIAAPAYAQDAESQVFNAAKTCDGLKAYLRAYPDGRFHDAAQSRIEHDCKPAPAPSLKAATEKPSSTDPCVQARADWKEMADSKDIPVLQAFINQTPASCGVQRAQAQVRMDALKAAAAEVTRKADAARADQARKDQQRKTVLNILLGTWKEVTAPSANCMMWDRYVMESGRVVEYEGQDAPTNAAKNTFEVTSDDPPTIFYAAGGYTNFIDGSGRLRIRKADGTLSPCEYEKQR